MTALSYQQLVADHDQIERLADAILEMAHTPKPDSAAIAARLAELALVVADHIRQEDALLYPQLARAAGSVQPHRVAEQLDALKRDWLEYLREWPEFSIAADTETFAAETAEILSRLKTRVRLESDLLYSSALRNGKISLR